MWYAPDQRFTEKISALVPFFGQPAAIQCRDFTTRKHLGRAGAAVFSGATRGQSGYVMRIGIRRFENFPSGDPVADTQRFHALIEAHVRRCPEQYLWATNASNCRARLATCIDDRPGKPKHGSPASLHATGPPG